jgi:hypothetical protein
MLKLLRLKHSRIGIEFEGTSYVELLGAKGRVDSGAPTTVVVVASGKSHHGNTGTTRLKANMTLAIIQPKYRLISKPLLPLLANPFPMQMKFDP